MKRDEGHTGAFSPRDPPLATGKRLRDEPREGFGASFPAPRPCVVMSAQAARGTLQFVQPCLLCASVYPGRRGGGSQRSRSATALVSALWVNE